MLAGNITAAKLDNPNITLASDNDTGSPSFALEGSLTVSGGEGIDTLLVVQLLQSLVRMRQQQTKELLRLIQITSR